LEEKILVQKLKGFSLLVLMLSLLFSSFQVTQAYVKEGWRLSVNGTSYKWGSNLDSGSSVIKSGWQSADSAWGSATNTNFFYHSSSVNILNSWYEYSSTYFGRYTVNYNSSNVVTKATGDLNSGNTDITKPNVAKSSGVHEFGHWLGIGHNSGTSIMNSGRDRELMHVPQTDDKNGVNAIY
jgi:hypothetical protein